LIVFIWKILYFSAKLKFLSMILMFFNVLEKQWQNLSLASLYRVKVKLTYSGYTQEAGTFLMERMAARGMRRPRRLLSCQPRPQEASRRGRGSPRHSHTPVQSHNGHDLELETFLLIGMITRKKAFLRIYFLFSCNLA
jgi:hypothetical protein